VGTLIIVIRTIILSQEEEVAEHQDVYIELFCFCDLAKFL